MTADRRPSTDRIPPQSVEMEQAVLGAMLIERPAIEKAADILRPEDFYRPEHRTIFEAIVNLVERNEPVDLLTVREQLRLQERLDHIGGAPYLHLLTDAVPTAANVEYYAKIVQEKAILRCYLDTASQIQSLAHSEYEEFSELHAALLGVAMEAGNRHLSNSNILPMRAVINLAWEELEERSENPGSLIGIETGFSRLDNATSGLRPGELIVIGARPGIGKSALGLNIARHVAGKHGTVIYFSLEMSKKALGGRAIFADARVNSHTGRRGQLSDDDWTKVGHSCSKLADLPMWIDDTPSINVLSIKNLCRRIAADHGVELAVVDYLQLVQPHKKADNRTQEVGQISRALKGMARELECPVIALSQLSRQTESRADKRPTMSDLRESGDIEADADMIWLLHELRKADDENPAGPVDLLVEKNRDGARGAVPLWFHRQFTRFDQRDEDHK